jgi:hypothetical protein
MESEFRQKNPTDRFVCNHQNTKNEKKYLINLGVFRKCSKILFFFIIILSNKWSIFMNFVQNTARF